MYNTELADRVRLLISHIPNINEKKMFGGLVFMVNNKMCITISKDKMMCRINPEQYETLLNNPGAFPVIMRGHQYKGYINIHDNILASDQELTDWVHLSIQYNSQLINSK